MKRKISIVTPVYNEQESLERLAESLKSIFDKHSDYDFEVVMIENGSFDRSWEIAKKIHQEDSRFKVLRLSRNFRMDGGLTAGLHYITGDAAVLMASDLQDPPELISEFIAKWEQGYDNVYQIVTVRNGTSRIRRFHSWLFYRLANLLTGGMLPRNVSDFRIVDKKVYETINAMQERNRFMRGLFAWSGFKHIGIPYPRGQRYGGKSGAHFFKVLFLALQGIFAHSYVPLKLVLFSGIILSSLSFLYLIFFTVMAILYGVPFEGYGLIIGILLLMFGFLFTCLGIIGEYIGLIYEEVKRRPNFVVRDKLGLNDFE